MANPSEVLTDASHDHRWQRHEWLLSMLGCLTSLALAWRAGPASQATVHTAFATILFCMIVAATRNGPVAFAGKLRFLAAYGFVLWYYTSVASIVPALHIPTHDAALLKLDTAIFGVTPAVWMQSAASVGFNEVMSGCYLSYLVYLHVCVAHAVLMPAEKMRQFAAWVFSVYAMGLAGYVVYPAVGPATAFPELFGSQLKGPLLTPLNRMVVASGSSIYDAFPSLHVLITCTLLNFDRRHCRRRFVWMLVPALGIFTSAIYLRYHYAVDLIAGGVMFVVVMLCFGEGDKGDVETRNADE